MEYKLHEEHANNKLFKAKHEYKFELKEKQIKR